MTADVGIGGPLPEVLGRLGTAPFFQWKHQDPFLLFRANRPSLSVRHSAVAWPELQALRTSADAHEGYLTPQDWLKLARLSQAQLGFLSHEFPDATRLRNVQVLLRLVAGMSEREQKAVGSSTGAGWEDCAAATRARLATLYPPAVARRVRIRVQWETESKPPAGQFLLGPGDGEARPLRLEFYRRRKPDEEPARARGNPTQP
ncbi:MAG: hypothetical protein FJX77_12710 [Armatimonadetes bacterium]|nr:hypothetical protein [Armatimonadota bacterium]